MKTILYFAVRQSDSAREINRGVQNYAQAHDWDLRMVEFSPAVREIRELMRFWSPDGCLVMCCNDMNPIALSPFEGLPTVQIDRTDNRQASSDTVSYVFCDNRAVAQMAARELLALDLASYVYVRTSKPLRWCRERADEFRRILALHGKKLTVLTSEQADDLSSVRRIADAFARLPKPVGVFAANDQVAERMLSVCQRAGLSVPDEVSVIGVDDDADVCEYAKPTLSSIGIDFRQAGFRAAEALDALMSGRRKTPSPITYSPTRLIRRESTRRLRKTDPVVNKALEMIRKDLHTTAAKVAATFPCSRRMAEIRFRAATGQSILEEIHATRLAKAQELIAAGDLKVSAIANFCGYRSAAALAKFLRTKAESTRGKTEGQP